MNEEKYYENPEFWGSDKYLGNKQDIERFNCCAEMMPNQIKTLLDVGCGNGSFIKYLEARSLPLTITGLERSNTAIESSVCASQILNGTIEKLPFDDNSFDMVSALEVIEHLPYGIYDIGLSELERVAKQYILISVPYMQKRGPIECPYCGCSFEPHYHLRSFNKDDINKLFKNFQFVSSKLFNMELHYGFYDFLKFIYKFKKNPNVLQSFPATALCPQCGFHKDSQSSLTKHPERKDYFFKKFIKRIWPKIEKAERFVTLYKRM